jgi:hypothetical protein
MSQTPGPWTWESVPGARGKKRRILTGGTKSRSKILTLASDCVGMDSADARLVAAAPDLLAACRLCATLPVDYSRPEQVAAHDAAVRAVAAAEDA